MRQWIGTERLTSPAPGISVVTSSGTLVERTFSPTGILGSLGEARRIMGGAQAYRWLG